MGKKEIKTVDTIFDNVIVLRNIYDKVTDMKYFI